MAAVDPAATAVPTRPPPATPRRPDRVEPSRFGAGAERRDARRWLLVVAGGLALTAVAVRLHLPLGTASAPFIGSYRVKVEIGSVLAPLVAAVVLIAAAAGHHERLPWRRLQWAGYLAASGWALALALVDGGNGLATPVARPDGYLVDVPAVGGDPVRFLHDFVAHADRYSVATRQHPPGPVLLLWSLRAVGLTRPLTIGVLITVTGALAVPLLAASVRSLCGEPAARRVLPALVLAPYAVWLAVSMDAVVLALAAAAVTCGVLGAEPGRPLRWAAGSGALLGVATLFNYSVAWLGVTVVVTYFVRRRPLLNVVSGATALVPLGLARAAGFVWPDGLTAAQADFSLRVGPERSWLLWAPLDVLVLLVACGPVVVPALRRARASSAWPFAVGAAIAVGFALGSGLSRGEVERSWLAFYPWLLLPAVAPARGAPAGSAPRTPLLLVAVGAATAVVLESVLRTAW